MVNVIILLLHLVFTIWIALKKYKEKNISDALLNVALIIILFAVGWSLLAMVINMFVEPAGLGKHFDRDTITLTLLTIAEFFFYRVYYAKELGFTK